MEAKAYKRWTKEALVERILQLEHDAAQPPPPQNQKNQQGGDHHGEGPPAAPPPQKKRPDRPMDASRYSTRLVALKLAYVGKQYGGFEYQASGSLPTVEEELWKALVRSCLINPDPDSAHEVRLEDPRWGYSKCGRTDRGVSAYGQVIALRLRSNRPLPKGEAVAEGEKKGGLQEGNEGVEEEEPTAVSAESAADNNNDDDDAALAAELPGLEIGGDEELGGPEPEAAEDESSSRPFDDFRDEIQYCRVLNRLLPADIRVLAWCPTTPADFSARHHCRERQYRYYFTNPAFAPLPEGLINPEAPRRPAQGGGGGGGGEVREGWLDIEAMRDAARRFEGLHDFRNFCKVDASKLIDNFHRRVFEADVVEVPDAGSALPFLGREGWKGGGPPGDGDGDRFPKVYYLHVRGSAFLWHQIRCMVAVLLNVAQGLEPPSVVDELLDVERRPCRPNYVLANETPLVLWDCIFPAESLAGQPKEEQQQQQQQQQQDDDIKKEEEQKEGRTSSSNRRPPLRDAMGWVHVGEESALHQHGSHGLLDGAWALWRERKMDEVLAAQLLDVISRGPDVTRRLDPSSPSSAPVTQRVFEGADRPVFSGRYVPVLAKKTLPSPAEVYDREARRHGHAGADAWRAAKAARRAELAGAAAEEDGGD